MIALRHVSAVAPQLSGTVGCAIVRAQLMARCTSMTPAPHRASLSKLVIISRSSSSNNSSSIRSYGGSNSIIRRPLTPARLISTSAVARSEADAALADNAEVATENKKQKRTWFDDPAYKEFAAEFPNHVFYPKPPPRVIPVPRDGMTVEKFLKTIARGAEQYSSKYTSWDQFWALDGRQFRADEVKPAKVRRWILSWMEKYRQGIDPFYISVSSSVARKNNPGMLKRRTSPYRVRGMYLKKSEYLLVPFGYKGPGKKPGPTEDIQPGGRRKRNSAKHKPLRGQGRCSPV